MKPKGAEKLKLKILVAVFLAAVLFSLCACVRLSSAIPDTTDPPAKKSLNETVTVGGKTYPSVDGRGFASDFPTEDVLDEEKRVVKGIDFVLYSGTKSLVEGYSEYVYDESGNVVNRKKYDTLGSLTAEYRYTIDEAVGKPSKTEVYDGNGAKISEKTYTYERVLCLNQSPYFDMLEKTVTEYDGEGNLTEVVEYEYFDTVRATYPKRAVYYNAKGKITKAFDFDESGDYKYLYTYENGELVGTKEIG